MTTYKKQKAHPDQMDIFKTNYDTIITVWTAHPTYNSLANVVMAI